MKDKRHCPAPVFVKWYLHNLLQHLSELRQGTGAVQILMVRVSSRRLLEGQLLLVRREITSGRTAKHSSATDHTIVLFLVSSFSLQIIGKKKNKPIQQVK